MRIGNLKGRAVLVFGDPLCKPLSAVHELPWMSCIVGGLLEELETRMRGDAKR